MNSQLNTTRVYPETFYNKLEGLRQRMGLILFGVALLGLSVALGVIGPAYSGDPISAGDFLIMGLAIGGTMVFYLFKAPQRYSFSMDSSVIKDLSHGPQAKLFLTMLWFAFVFMTAYLFIPYLTRVVATIIALAFLADIIMQIRYRLQ